MIAKAKRFKKSSRPPKFRRNLVRVRQTIFFSTLIGCLVLLVIGFLVFSNLKISQKRAELTARIESLKKEIQILEEKNEELQAGISQGSSQTFLEKEARERLGLQKSGEQMVVVLPPEGSEEEKTKEQKNFWQRLLDPVRNFFEGL